MKKRSRGLWAILFGLPALLAVPVVLIGSSVYQAGTIEVRVVEKSRDGVAIGATIPAIAVPLALRLAPAGVMDEFRSELGSDGRWAMDVARAVAEELSAIPDGVLVDVRTRTEIVTVEKRDGKIELNVDTPGETVRASVPLRAVSALVDAI